MKPYLSLFLLALTLLASPEGAWAKEKKLKVVAATESLKSVVEAVGGDRVDVDAIAKPDDDPHFIEVKPSYILKMRKADLIVKIGMELDQWMDAIAEQAGNRAILRGQPGHVDASQKISALEVPAVLDRSQGDVHPFGNPHYMLDPENAVLVAKTVCDALSGIDPSSAQVYEVNRAAFEKKLRGKMEGWNKRMAPFQGASVITFHRSMSYFIRRFGLKCPIELEPKPGVPPSAEHLDRVVQVAKAQDARCILEEVFRPREPGEFVGSKAGIPVLVLHGEPSPKEGLPDYIAMMDRMVDKVAGALEKGVPSKEP